MPVFNLLLLSFRESLGGGGLCEAQTFDNRTSTLSDGFYLGTSARAS